MNGSGKVLGVKSLSQAKWAEISLPSTRNKFESKEAKEGTWEKSGRREWGAGRRGTVGLRLTSPGQDEGDAPSEIPVQALRTPELGAPAAKGRSTGQRFAFTSLFDRKSH